LADPFLMATFLKEKKRNKSVLLLADVIAILAILFLFASPSIVARADSRFAVATPQRVVAATTAAAAAGASSSSSCSFLSSFSSPTYVYAMDLGTSQLSVVKGKYLVATIDVGGSLGIQGAFDPLNKMVYVPDGDSVSVVNTTTNAVGATIKGFNIAEGTQYLPVGNGDGLIAVSDTGTNNVTIIDARSSEPIATVVVGASPEFMAFDSVDRTLWVVNVNGPSVSVIDTTTWTVVKTLTKGLVHPRGIAYNPSNGYMYVVDETYKTNLGAVFVFEASNFAHVKTISSPKRFFRLWDVAYNPLNGLMYVTDLYGGANSQGGVVLINGSKIAKQVFMQPSGSENVPVAAAFDPSNGLMYVTLASSSNLAMINNRKVLGTQIYLGNPNALPEGLIVAGSYGN
jgi:YVTN family beta-propeller protein